MELDLVQFEANHSFDSPGNSGCLLGHLMLGNPLALA